MSIAATPTCRQAQTDEASACKPAAASSVAVPSVQPRNTLGTPALVQGSPRVQLQRNTLQRLFGAANALPVQRRFSVKSRSSKTSEFNEAFPLDVQQPPQGLNDTLKTENLLQLTRPMVIDNLYRMSIDAITDRRNFKSWRTAISVALGYQAGGHRTDEQKYDEAYNQALAKGMGLVMGAAKGGSGKGAQFGISWDAYDKKYWKKVEQESDSDESDSEDSEVEYKLVKKAGITPAEAIDFLFADPSAWAFDCCEAIQVARWYAQRHALGAAKFNAKFDGVAMELKQIDSSGLTGLGVATRIDRKGYYDQTKGFTFKFDRGGKPRGMDANAATLLERAPIGSRAMWRNWHDDVDDDAAFKNENAIKTGPDLYMAHPLGVGNEEFVKLNLANQHMQANLDDSEQRAKLLEYTRLHVTLAELEFFDKK